MSGYIDEAELGDVLKIKKKTIQNLRCSTPWRLPPECTPDGQRKRIWRREDVDNWLRNQVRTIVEQPRRPGRPRKAPAKVVRCG